MCCFLDVYQPWPCMEFIHHGVLGKQDGSEKNHLMNLTVISVLCTSLLRHDIQDLMEFPGNESLLNFYTLGTRPTLDQSHTACNPGQALMMRQTRLKNKKILAWKVHSWAIFLPDHALLLIIYSFGDFFFPFC